VATDVTTAAESILDVPVAVELFASVRAQFPDSSPAPKVAVCNILMVPLLGRKLSVFPLIAHSPRPAPGMAVYVAS
jgi:hypothetical protein